MINMNKEYRAELRDLKKQERAIYRASHSLANAGRRQINGIRKNIVREGRIMEKAVARILKRRAVLEGRLS